MVELLIYQKDDCVSFDLCGAEGICSTTKAIDKDGPNEDALLVKQLNDNSAVIAIADGLGGHISGEKAAKLQITLLNDALNSVGTSNAGVGTEVRNAILNAIEKCNDRLLSEKLNSATTIIVVEIHKNRLRTYHVGDSTAMLTGQRGLMKAKTLPHSYVSLGIESGLLDPTEEINHKDRHYITNYVGKRDMRVEVGTEFQCDKFDTLLVCSDGLTDNLSTLSIVELIQSGPIDDCLRNLHSACSDAMHRDKGRFDDLTIVLLRPGIYKTSGNRISKSTSSNIINSV